MLVSLGFRHFKGQPFRLIFLHELQHGVKRVRLARSFGALQDRRVVSRQEWNCFDPVPIAIDHDLSAEAVDGRIYSEAHPLAIGRINNCERSLAELAVEAKRLGRMMARMSV